MNQDCFMSSIISSLNSNEFLIKMPFVALIYGGFYCMMHRAVSILNHTHWVYVLSLIWVYLRNLVKLAEELVQHVHEFSWRAVAGQPGEAHDVCVEDAAENQRKHV